MLHSQGDRSHAETLALPRQSLFTQSGICPLPRQNRASLVETTLLLEKKDYFCVGEKPLLWKFCLSRTTIIVIEHRFEISLFAKEVNSLRL